MTHTQLQIRTRLLFLTAISVLSLYAGGCALFPKAPPEALQQTPLKYYPQFYDDMDYEGLNRGIQQSLLYLRKLPPERSFHFGKDSYSASHMVKSLEHFLSFIQQKPSAKDLQQFIESDYLVYRSAGSEKMQKVLFTGYYEPFLKGSLKKTPVYRFPVYSIPIDLMTIDLSLFSNRFKGEKKLIGRVTENQAVVPYYERKEIETTKALEGKAQAIAWVDNKIDLFFLEIQGSGIIYLDTGEKLNVHYHSSNGQPYRAIGKLLADEGKIPKDKISMQAIRAYLANHPDEVQDILNYNPSYIFFKTEDDGPFGCLGVALSAGRSLALDRKLFPSAGLAFIETQKPTVNDEGRISAWSDFSRFVLNQDTGGAIKGPGRADLFWGNDNYAEIAAGYMQQKGTLYFLILKPGINE